jgi:hypothetical protein
MLPLIHVRVNYYPDGQHPQPESLLDFFLPRERLLKSTCALYRFSIVGSSEITSSLAALGVTAASPGAMYPGPSADTANECMCNTVTYSMISACGACQNGTVER